MQNSQKVFSQLLAALTRVNLKLCWIGPHPAWRQLLDAFLWKAVVNVPCNLQRVVINLQRVVDINQYSHIFYNAL